MIVNQSDLVRFKLNKERCVEGIDLLSQQWPGITQYYICKTFFFADREHFLDWGRVISGDDYYALEHGPVPTRVYNLLKPDSSEDGDWLSYLNSRVTLRSDGNKRRAYTKGMSNRPNLASTHQEYLERWLSVLKPLSFGVVADIAHEDRAWQQAWGKMAGAQEMDLTLWLDPAEPDLEFALQEMREAALFGH